MSIELLQGDCLSIIPTLSSRRIDTVITDPVWPNCPPGLLEGWQDPFQLLQSALDLINARRVIIVLRYDSDPRFLAAVPNKWPFFRLQTLKYAVPGYNGRKLGGVEIAYCFGEPVKSRPGRRVIPGEGPTVTHRTPSNGHACPRAVEHFTWLVNWWTEPGDVVLDPFMGSNTTGVACYKMGRDYIGIEKDPEYYQISRDRLGEAQTSPMLEGVIA
jgi:site-specific DNA-methyltransferase (adenine-specific)